MNQQPPQPPNCDEQRAEFEALIGRAGKLDAMTRTPGWMEVLEPMLLERRMGYVERVCTEVDHEQVRRLQAGIQEIDAILGFVNTIIVTATEAQASLRREDE